MAKKTSDNIDKILKKTSKKKSKRISNYDKEVLINTTDGLCEDLKWFYKQVKDRQTFADDKTKKEVAKDINIRNIDRIADKLYSLKDICKLLAWTFPKNKIERKRLANISNTLHITGHDAHALLYNFTIRSLKEDTENPSDFLLSKKEQRQARKRRKMEKKHSDKPRIKIQKNDDEKKEARKERAKIRKEAKKLGISTAEYKEKMAKRS